VEGDRVDRRDARYQPRDTAGVGPAGAEVDAGRRPGLTTDERARLKDQVGEAGFWPVPDRFLAPVGAVRFGVDGQDVSTEACARTQLLAKWLRQSDPQDAPSPAQWPASSANRSRTGRHTATRCLPRGHTVVTDATRRGRTGRHRLPTQREKVLLSGHFADQAAPADIVSPGVRVPLRQHCPTADTVTLISGFAAS
jgi:hypothetical protein